MEDVLDLYHEPYDETRPVVCFDESNKELHKEVRDPLPARPGAVARYDYTYERNGTRNLFVVSEPLSGWRHVEVTERRRKQEFVAQMQSLVDDHYPDADCIRVVMDNLNTHQRYAFYEHLPPAEARRLLSKLEFHFTPEHGSWLNMAEIEFSALWTECLDSVFLTQRHSVRRSLRGNAPETRTNPRLIGSSPPMTLASNFASYIQQITIEAALD
jgi:hypothetical protein